jgi:hypothetical protein
VARQNSATLSGVSANLNRLTLISNAPEADAAVSFGYRYNSASQL